MSKIKEGDIVGRISYGKDVFFHVKRIIKLKDGTQLAILKGLTVRIEADSPLDDLELIEQNNVDSNLRGLEQRLEIRIKNYLKPNKGIEIKNEKRSQESGKILHLDGDKRYSEKALRYYKKMGLNAVVKNVAESNQPKVITALLNRYKPDVLVITGHDGMIKNGTDFRNIYNYRNSRYFIETVLKARKWKEPENDLVIFARGLPKFFRSNNGGRGEFCVIPTEEF